MKIHQLIFFIGFFPLYLCAQDCTSQWETHLSTDPLVAKKWTGDTTAAYAIFSFKGDPRIGFRLHGRFPQARFMSVQTYVDRLQKSFDGILDFEIQPDFGSENPFQKDYIDDRINQKFTIEILPEGIISNAPNIIHLPANRKIHSFAYRVYVPKFGEKVGFSDLPKIQAFNIKTHESIQCPAWESYHKLDLSQLLVSWVLPKQQYEFKDFDVHSGSNKAIPYYLYALNRQPPGTVNILRFKAPTFQDKKIGIYQDNIHVRYWSLCMVNIVAFTTMACLPDFNAKVDRDGFVTLIHGGGEQVRKKAEEHGFNYFDDTREDNQRVIMFAYRNLLPNRNFMETQMYQDEFRPRGILCSISDFMVDRCNF